jgi:hypothetical protein
MARKLAVAGLTLAVAAAVSANVLVVVRLLGL